LSKKQTISSYKCESTACSTRGTLSNKPANKQKRRRGEERKEKIEEEKLQST